MRLSVGIISYCLLTFFFCFVFLLSFVGAAVQVDTPQDHGAVHTDQTTTTDIDSHGKSAPPE
jgi:hypothetical protein